MSEGANPPRRAVPDPEEMPWSISYLRDDIKELRAEMGAQLGVLHNRIDETHRSLSDRIDETNRSLSEINRSLGERIDETNRSLSETNGSLGERIDETNRSLGERIDEFNRSLGERIDETNKRLDTHFRWIMGTLVTLTGVLIAVIKL